MRDANWVRHNENFARLVLSADYYLKGEMNSSLFKLAIADFTQPMTPPELKEFAQYIRGNPRHD